MRRNKPILLDFALDLSTHHPQTRRSPCRTLSPSNFGLCSPRKKRNFKGAKTARKTSSPSGTKRSTRTKKRRSVDYDFSSEDLAEEEEEEEEEEVEQPSVAALLVPAARIKAVARRESSQSSAASLTVKFKESQIFSQGSPAPALDVSNHRAPMMPMTPSTPASSPPDIGAHSKDLMPVVTRRNIREWDADVSSSTEGSDKNEAMVKRGREGEASTEEEDMDSFSSTGLRPARPQAPGRSRELKQGADVGVSCRAVRSSSGSVTPSTTMGACSYFEEMMAEYDSNENADELADLRMVGMQV